ncbi:MAG: NAD(P)/FAD-dependent oxidoreductase [Thermoplasmata archaeon]
MRTDVLVVGGGPAGSTAARLLARDYDVVILEEHRTPGEPLQCAGLVTQKGVPMFARESVIGEIRGARLHSPLGFTLTLEARTSRAYVLDRSHFDRMMFHKAVDAGAVPRVGSSARAVRDTGYEVHTETRSDHHQENFTSRIVVGADGYKSICRRSSHLPVPKHMLTGIQVDLKGVETDQEFVELFLGRDVAPGFFAWAIPAGDLVRVGLCTWDAADLPAMYLKKFLTRPQFKHAKSVSTTSGKIPIGPGRSAVSGRIMLVGDAACHAKPLSGGGVYTGVRGAELCSEAVSEFFESCEASGLGAYDRLWKDEFGKELSRAFRIRRIFLALTDKKMDKALRIFSEPEVRRLLEQKGDIDYPASLSSAVLKLAPRLAQFSPQIIESFL